MPAVVNVDELSQRHSWRRDKHWNETNGMGEGERAAMANQGAREGQQDRPQGV